ncbi:SMP-30/gluconolactonase/LRE family protein [Verrucomicrobiaceae bacterium N1E253]|uniref:Regucalcin n=1 Tax=Oceaniferula marina TaxID=2748318 RepID=A0A851GBG6_9BACT|nr:SMP-30/gluconolactonase/LRE family protein [Oceaniferula marina]NWK54953.1 SMP-30/gluconolactonase/LRE family protein [Oceaniferula marina]
MQIHQTAFTTLPAPASQLGESGAWWKGAFYWVDILGKTIWKWDPQTQETCKRDVSSPIGTIHPIAEEQDQLIIALQHAICRFSFADGKTHHLTNLESDIPNNRANDGKCDPSGRFWVGTMDMDATPHCGNLYRMEKDHSLTRMVSNVSISNGIAWSNDTMYYIDTLTSIVEAFDYDNATGTISNRRPICKIPTDLGYPDGMNIDAEGKLWVALWGGSAVARIDPTPGKITDLYRLPTSQITNCTFGGDDLQDLYITTAKEGLSEEQLAAQPLAGKVFIIRTTAKGKRIPPKSLNAQNHEHQNL